MTNIQNKSKSLLLSILSVVISAGASSTVVTPINNSVSTKQVVGMTQNNKKNHTAINNSVVNALSPAKFKSKEKIISEGMDPVSNLFIVNGNISLFKKEVVRYKNKELNITIDGSKMNSTQVEKFLMEISKFKNDKGILTPVYSGIAGITLINFKDKLTNIYPLVDEMIKIMKLKSVEMVSCNISDKDMEYLGVSVAASSLVRLSLSANNISDVGLEQFFDKIILQGASLQLKSFSMNDNASNELLNLSYMNKMQAAMPNLSNLNIHNSLSLEGRVNLLSHIANDNINILKNKLSDQVWINNRLLI